MLDQETVDYYRTRERRERVLAQSHDRAAAAIHLALANHYQKLLVEDGSPPVPVHRHHWQRHWI